MTIKVVQWTSGGVARQAVRAILDHPGLALVGMYAHNLEKAGEDAGELVGLEPLGIKATNDIDSLIALKPDCVSYSPLYPDIDHLAQLLESGINIVTTCNFLTGWGMDFRAGGESPSPRQRLQNAAMKGKASIFGTGINPGHINYLACVLSAHCQSIRHIKVTESVDVFSFVGDKNMQKIGFGLPRNSPGHAEEIKRETAVFGDAIELMASMMDTPLDEIRCSVEFAYANEHIPAPGRPIAKDCVAGVRICWEGCADNKPLFANEQIWLVGSNTDSNWPIQHGYIVNIQGDPGIYNVMIPIPKGDLASMSPADMNAVGMRITALPSINAISAVCRAAPGICTYKELPPITGQGRLRF
jgi:hypothetical protein